MNIPTTPWLILYCSTELGCMDGEQLEAGVEPMSTKWWRISFSNTRSGGSHCNGNGSTSKSDWFSSSSMLRISSIASVRSVIIELDIMNSMSSSNPFASLDTHRSWKSMELSKCTTACWENPWDTASSWSSLSSIAFTRECQRSALSLYHAVNLKVIAFCVTTAVMFWIGLNRSKWFCRKRLTMHVSW